MEALTGRGVQVRASNRDTNHPWHRPCDNRWAAWMTLPGRKLGISNVSYIQCRIPYEQGMAAFNAAQMMGVPSKLLVFPEENHWILQPQNSLFWHREFYSWLERWVKE